MTKKKTAPQSEQVQGSGVPGANDPASTVAPRGGAPEEIDGDAPEFVTIAFPLPPSGPSIEELLQHEAALVVTAKPERGRWRAGRFFTREASVIPFGDVAAQIDVLTGDPELVVAVRLPRQV